jgi:hypothetical protein
MTCFYKNIIINRISAKRAQRYPNGLAEQNREKLNGAKEKISITRETHFIKPKYPLHFEMDIALLKKILLYFL